jgi:hypothetical protein
MGKWAEPVHRVFEESNSENGCPLESERGTCAEVLLRLISYYALHHCTGYNFGQDLDNMQGGWVRPPTRGSRTLYSVRSMEKMLWQIFSWQSDAHGDTVCLADG